MGDALSVDRAEDRERMRSSKEIRVRGIQVVTRKGNRQIEYSRHLIKCLSIQRTREVENAIRAATAYSELQEVYIQIKEAKGMPANCLRSAVILISSR